MQVPKISLDDLFTTQEQRDDNKLEKVVDIRIDNIDDFPNHPFKVVDNDGRYELVSGHRRKFASELALKETIPCIVRNLSDDEAIIIMVDSNMQREEILPSEKAFAYK